MAAATRRAPRCPRSARATPSSSSPARTPASAARSSASSGASRAARAAQPVPARHVRGRWRRRRRRGHQHRQAAHQAAPDAERDRPDAEGPAGRHPRHRPAPADRQGHGRLPAAATSRPGSRHATLDDGRRVRVCGHCGEQLEVQGVTSRLQRALHGGGRAGAPEAVRVRQPDAGAAPDEDRRQHRPRRGADRTPRRSMRPSATWRHHRPEADRDQGQALDRPVPAADRQPDRGQGHPARRADVGLPGAADDARAAAHPRLPRRPGQVVRRPRQLHASGCASSSRSRRSTTTRSTVCAGWRSASSRRRRPTRSRKRLLELLGMPFAGVGAGRSRWPRNP